MRTGPGGSSSNSIANSVLIRALPRSISTSTPSADIAFSIAVRTRSASVPSTGRVESVSSTPPAASSTRSSPPISRARVTTPSASAALWETTTIPTGAT